MKRMTLTIKDGKLARMQEHKERLATAKPNSIAVKRPDLLEEWDWEKNDELGLDPYTIAYGSGKTKVWWLCLKHKHSYDMTPNNRTSKKSVGCPYCSGRRVLVGYNDFATIHPDLANEWDYERNSSNPTEYTACSSAKVWWVCPSFGHSYEAMISNRVSINSGCSICAGKVILEGFNDLATTNPKCIDDWDYELNNLTPQEVSHASGKKVWWKCHEGHDSYLQTVSKHTAGRGCPKCAIESIRNKNRKGALGNKTTRNKNRNGALGNKTTHKQQVVYSNSLSYKYPKLAEEWHPVKNGNLTPVDVAGQSHMKVWWLGKCGHEWEAVIKNRVRENAGCPECSKWLHTSFPEQAIYFYVSKQFDIVINNEKPKLDGFGRFSLDVYVPSIKTAIEYDGQRWHSAKQAQDRDARKDDACLKAGITLFRIREPGCPDYKGCSANLIVREHATTFESLDNAIVSLLLKLGVTQESIDVDTFRDEIAINELMRRERTKNSIATLYPDVAAQWDYEKNGNNKPWMYTPSSKLRAWWMCPKGHGYQMRISHRCNGHGCSTCWNEKRKSQSTTTPAQGQMTLELSA